MTCTNVLITGASSGIGRQLALEYAEDYSRLFKSSNLAEEQADGPAVCLGLVARRLDELEKLKENILAKFPNVQVEVAKLDVTDVPAVFDVLTTLVSNMPDGLLDVAIVNAGIGTNGKLVGTGLRSTMLHVQVLQTNIVGAYAVIAWAVEHFRKTRRENKALIKERGRPLVAAIGSVAQYGALPTSVAYSASKVALDHVMKGTRIENLRHDSYIDFSLINPGFIDTPISPDNKKMPFVIPASKGGWLIYNAIQRRSRRSEVPWFPWAPVSLLMRNLPTDRLYSFFVPAPPKSNL
ncbi:hypothetical protein BJ742DRAFT_790139 [Cladochytrium replicatum]|nr:hypothetical protein BJ742DRAFT_790139 [Cladochytrium replicatum]